MPLEVTVLYVCPHCLIIGETPGTCANCGHQRVECNPGDPDNPCRRPPMDAEGRILARAPLWWLARSVPHLRKQVKEMTGQ